MLCYQNLKDFGNVTSPETITRSSCCIEGMAFIFITFLLFYLFSFILKVWELKLPQPLRPRLAWEVSFCNFKFQNCRPLCSFYQAPQSVIWSSTIYYWRIFNLLSTNRSNPPNAEVLIVEVPPYARVHGHILTQSDLFGLVNVS